MSRREHSDCRSALPGATGSQGRAQKRAPTSSKKPPPHQSALRKGRWSWPNHCYFVTANATNKQPIFADPRAAQIIIDSLIWLQNAGRIRLMGFVVMPDHVHVAFVMGDGRSRAEARSYSASPVGAPFRARPALAGVMNSFKGFTGKKINELLHRHGDVWQPAYYDHLVRDEKDFRTRLDYMHANPTRRALAQFEHAYEFSSANPKYAGLVDWNWLLGAEPVAPGRALLQHNDG
jgi:putative transposase